MSEVCYNKQNIEPLPISLLRRPLEYILADHLRQRVLCHLCDRIATAETLDVDLTVEVVGYLERDMAVHVIDEEQDFFPLLRRRAEPEDEIEPALGLLSGEHAADQILADKILEGLTAALNQPAEGIADAVRDALTTFSENQRRHLSLENATVMPLAKHRLTEMDLANLSTRMAARRGVLLDEIEAPDR